MHDSFKRNIKSTNDEEYRKWSSRFPEYLFLDRDYRIFMAGKTVEELLQYQNGSLQNKDVNVVSEKNELKASLIIQSSKNFFEWKEYSLKARDGRAVKVEICGFKTDRGPEEAIAIRLRCSRSNFPVTSGRAAKKIARWISHNLRTPLAAIQVLINLALVSENEEDLKTHIIRMAVQVQQLDTKLKRMIRFANKVFK
jgi:nitrogen-specific signal transduction histidine kinase